MQGSVHRGQRESDELSQQRWAKGSRFGALHPLCGRQPKDGDHGMSFEALGTQALPE
jgi:hypothetical protein